MYTFTRQHRKTLVNGLNYCMGILKASSCWPVSLADIDDVPTLLCISTCKYFKSEISFFLLSVVWEPHLEEAETTFTVFKIHLFGVKVVQSPAESWRLGLLEGLHFRHLADDLQRAGSNKRTTAVTVVSVVPVLIHFVFRGDTVARREHQVSWRIPLLVTHGSSESKLKSRQKSHHVCSNEVVNLCSVTCVWC